ncbi:photosynthesis system II assembly factor Ycf48/Hcf136-like domain-containing protein [Ochromonadaceae sp. CCMP2298]|nr:photosynthesis system II assembly factor Ycf48/Hcf136-like domain-containing protein [Ochromonadaceae sp. CCMP2298]
MVGLQQVAATTTQVAAMGAGLLSVAKSASAKDKLVWKQVDIPTKETLFDVSFDPKKPEHGWVVGAKGTFLETFDGGVNWLTRKFNSLDEDEDIIYRFEVASLLDNEGWIIGKPSIMLHTRDGGKQFERIPLSPKLPGDPCSIKATGQGKAEMITTQGAVYTTENGGLNWKAQVKETIDATLNRVSSSGTSGASFFTGKIANQIRDNNGNYIAIGSRGNLFLTWSPGQDYWVPHNRGSSRRIQNMGFIGNDASKGVWMTLNGGALLTTTPNPDLSQVEVQQLFEPKKINSGGYGIIDVAWKDEKNVWAVGGSGIIFESTDGGKTFKFNSNAKDIPGNLYRVKFFGENGNTGFALGSNGVLLQYQV